MTTNYNLPEEVLHLVFKELDKIDLQECQYVCSSWYKAAHLHFLTTIDIDETCQTGKKFITSIDTNPDARYLKAVKSIDIDCDCGNEMYDQADLVKLFCRFPYMEKVSARYCPNLFENFDDSVCKALLQSCPRLNKFQLCPKNIDRRQYSQLLYKLRHVITVVNICYIDCDCVGLESLLEFMTSFPRLTQLITDSPPRLYGFEKLIPILIQLNNLTSLHLHATEDRADNAELVLRRKTKEEQDLVIARLSELKEFEVQYYSPTLGLLADSMKFASKYLTGLDSFKFMMETRLYGSQIKEICGSILDLFCSATNEATILIDDVRSNVLEQSFRYFEKKVFSHKQTTYILSVYICERQNESFRVGIYKRAHEIEITLETRTYDLNDPIWSLVLHKVDVFKFEVDKRIRYYNFVVDDREYAAFIGRRLEAVQEVPTSYSSRKTLGKVTNVTLRVPSGEGLQSLIDKYAYYFPSLKYLKLEYHSGTWDNTNSEFKINLWQYTIDRLVIDLTVLKKEMKNSIDRYCGDGEKSFMLKLECLATQRPGIYYVGGEKHSFKMPLGLSSVTEIKGAGDFSNTFTISIIVDSLKELYLTMGLDENFPVVRKLSTKSKKMAMSLYIS